MKFPALAAVLIAFSAPALAQTPGDHVQHHPEGSTMQQAQASPSQLGSQMPMGQMMQSGMMGGGHGRGMMGRFSAEDMSAFVDAHLAALKAGLKLSPEQERMWPPVEEALRNLARLHMTHMQAMRQSRSTMESDPVGALRTMADRMSQGADAMRKLADAAAPLYATLDDAQKRRLQTLVHFGPRGMMGRGMMGPGRRSMMRDWFDSDDDDDRN